MSEHIVGCLGGSVLKVDITVLDAVTPKDVQCPVIKIDAVDIIK